LLKNAKYSISTLCQETDKRNQLFAREEVAATITCELGTVKVFDSLFQKHDEKIKHTILNDMLLLLTLRMTMWSM